MGKQGLTTLPTGVIDPLFTCELALELGMTIRELGGGPPGMDVHELTVVWPQYFAYRQREARRQERKGR